MEFPSVNGLLDLLPVVERMMFFGTLQPRLGDDLIHRATSCT